MSSKMLAAFSGLPLPTSLIFGRRTALPTQPGLSRRDEDINVPDFEDQTAAKIRYCGSGDRCERL